MAKKAPAEKSTKFVYEFGKKTDGNAQMRNLLGGKGANLAEMARIGLPVPPGFTISTEVCTYYYENKKTYPKTLMADVRNAVANIEKQLGKKFGDATGFPLLVAVRSGARESMPGMMDTILNLGLNDETVEALARVTNNERFAWDCYRRFVQMYGDVVLGVQKLPNEDHEPFESVEKVIKENSDIRNKVDVFETMKKRMLVEDTDEGKYVKTVIGDLKLLIQAYQLGIIKERKQ